MFSKLLFSPNRQISVNHLFQQTQIGDEHSAVHEEAREQGRLPGAQHDPSGELHDETERHYRDDAHHVARIRQHPSLRSIRSGYRVCLASYS